MKCCDIKPSMMRHKISVERATKTRTAAGGFTTSWAPLIPLAMASAMNKGGTERLNGDRVESTRSVVFTTRYTADIAAMLEKDRVIFEGKAHNVRYINDIEYAHRWVEIHCDQGQPT